MLATELTEEAGAPDEGSIAFAELALLAMEAGRGRKPQPVPGEGWRWSTKDGWMTTWRAGSQWPPQREPPSTRET